MLNGNTQSILYKCIVQKHLTVAHDILGKKHFDISEKNPTYKYREQTDSCQREVGGGGKIVKWTKRYRLPVTE